MSIRNLLYSYTGNSLNQGLKGHLFVIFIQPVKLLLFPLIWVSYTCPVSTSVLLSIFYILTSSPHFMSLKTSIPFCHSFIIFPPFLSYFWFFILLVLLDVFSSFILLKSSIFKFALFYVGKWLAAVPGMGLVLLRPFSAKPWAWLYILLTGHWKMTKSVETWLHVQ